MLGLKIKRFGGNGKMTTEAEALAKAHWSYVEEVLTVAGVSPPVIKACEFHYTSAFIHGYKHGVESMGRIDMIPPQIYQIYRDGEADERYNNGG